MTFKTKNGEYHNCKFVAGRYNNGNLALQVIDRDGNSIVECTVNHTHSVEPTALAIKNYSENEDMVETLTEMGIIGKELYRLPYGYIYIPVHELTEKGLELFRDILSIHNAEKPTDAYIVKVPYSGKAEILHFDIDEPYRQIREAIGCRFFESALLIPSIKTNEPYVVDLFVDKYGLQKGLPLNTRLSCFCLASLMGDAIISAHSDTGNGMIKAVGLTKTDAESIVKTITNVGV